MNKVLRFSLAILFIFMTFASTTPAYAAGIVVNSNADNVTDDDFCTLREAITNANDQGDTFDDCTSGAGADTITFSSNYTITLGSQLPAVSTTMTINGTGLAYTIIQANASPNVATYRIFQVTSTGNLTLNALTVQNGRCNGSCVGDASFGGGVYNAAGDLTITNSKIANNSASEGGNVFTSYSNSSLTVSNSIFSGDATVVSGAGGAIMNGGGIVTITNSTFSNNFTTGKGGAIYNDGSVLDVTTITNSTFSGNTSTGDLGGAVYNNATMTIKNSTFSGNSSAHGAGATINNQASKTLNLYNTIIANSAGDKDCYSDGILNAGYNLIENNTTFDCGLANNVDGNITGSDPALNVLANNGGPTETFSLQLSSLALGSGDSTVCDDNPGPNSLDQRGVPRPGNGCDIGAYESNAQPGPTFTVNTDEDTDDGFCDEFITDLTDCTLREAITYANNISGTDTITFANNYTITLGDELPTVISTMIITGNGVSNTIIQGNAAPNTATRRIFFVNSGAGNLTLNNMTLRNGVCNGFCASSGTTGGAIYVVVGFLTINNSLISANTAADGGGALSTNSGTITINNSTFSDNSSPSSGGAIINTGTMTIANSTITNNSATGGGFAGGIRNLSTLNIYNSTISGNTANSGVSDGANIFQDAGALNLYNTIIANGINDGDCGFSGGTVNATNTLIESTGSLACNLSNGSLGNIIGSDPQLETLTGSPAYFPIPSTSPAFNAGDDAICAADPVNNASQNGITRPQSSHCDIGSFESPIISMTVTSALANDGWVLESSEKSGKGGTMNSTAATFLLGDATANRQYRAILHFNTAALPDTAVVASATLKIKKQGGSGSNPFTVLGSLRASVRKPAFGTTALQLADFKSAAGQNNVATFGSIPVANWYSAPIDSTGMLYLNRLGTTQFRLAFSLDDNNDNGNDLIKFFSGSSTPANRPQLIIEYYVP